MFGIDVDLYVQSLKPAVAPPLSPLILEYNFVIPSSTQPRTHLRAARCPLRAEHPEFPLVTHHSIAR